MHIILPLLSGKQETWEDIERVYNLQQMSPARIKLWMLQVEYDMCFNHSATRVLLLHVVVLKYPLFFCFDAFFLFLLSEMVFF